MLQSGRMNSRAYRQLAVVTGACLLVIPQTSLVSAGFRDDAVHYRQEGYEKQWQGDAADAMTAYRKAAALDSAYATPHNDLGILLEERNQFEEAEQEYLSALKLDPHSREAHTNLAILYERLEQKEKAVYYWLKRSQMGEASDPWVIRANQRLAALGIASWKPEPVLFADVSHEQTEAAHPMVPVPPRETVIAESAPPALKPEMSSAKEQMIPSPPQEDLSHTKRGAAEQEFKAQKQSLEDFRSMTKQGGDWK